MSADSVAGEGDALYCYRHPDREVYVRCGRCDRPICTGCAMLGPVGMRCKDCGKPAYDPLTSFTAAPAASSGSAWPLVGGVVAAFIASRIGFFSIIVSFFAGGLVAQAVVRVTGYKHGPRMLAVVFGGIAAGALIGFGLDVLLTLGDLNAIAAEVAAEAGEDAAGQSPIASLVGQMATWALVSAGATCAGAWSRRLRLTALTAAGPHGNGSSGSGVSTAPDPVPEARAMLRFVLRLIAATSLLLASVGVAPVSAGGGCHGEDGGRPHRGRRHRRPDGSVLVLADGRPRPGRHPGPLPEHRSGRAPRRGRGAGLGNAGRRWSPARSSRRTFAAKGVYPYSCPLHPGMVGAIVVGGADAAAVPPPAAAGGDSRAVGNAAPAVPAAGATQGAQTAPASQAGPSSAELVVVGAAIAAAAVIVALAWRRQSAGPTPSREA